MGLVCGRMRRACRLARPPASHRASSMSMGLMTLVSKWHTACGASRPAKTGCAKQWRSGEGWQ